MPFHTIPLSISDISLSIQQVQPIGLLNRYMLKRCENLPGTDHVMILSFHPRNSCYRFLRVCNAFLRNLASSESLEEEDSESEDDSFLCFFFLFFFTSSEELLPFFFLADFLGGSSSELSEEDDFWGGGSDFFFFFGSGEGGSESDPDDSEKFVFIKLINYEN